jgi:hypothetical protein
MCERHTETPNANASGTFSKQCASVCSADIIYARDSLVIPFRTACLL